MNDLQRLLLTCCALALAGCSTIYRSSDVVSGVSDGTKVRVVALNPETIVQANRSPFAPKTLPAIFSYSAGNGQGVSTRGAGLLPDAPSSQDAERSQQLRLSPPPPVENRPYQIGVGDVVTLATPATRNTVQELSGLLAAQNSRNGYTVQDDGSINIPDIGRVRLAGLTVDDAEALVFQRLVENQLDPTFSLEISEFNSQRVSVGGAVAKPGLQPLTLTPLHLEEALAAAGSVSVADIDVSSVRIYRDGKLYQIPLTDLYQDPALQRIRLAAGDAVFVDTDFNLDRAETYFEQQIRLTETTLDARARALDELTAQVNLNRANLNEQRSNFERQDAYGAVDRDYVYLAGEVSTQKRFALPFGQTASLADALYDGGTGISKKTGDVSQVYVLRASSNPREFGAVTAWHLNASNAAQLVLATKFELRPDDMIFVAENPVTKWSRTIDQITPSLITSAVSTAN
jgi:polysaccharide export outer membrane protein